MDTLPGRINTSLIEHSPPRHNVTHKEIAVCKRVFDLIRGSDKDIHGEGTRQQQT